MTDFDDLMASAGTKAVRAFDVIFELLVTTGKTVIAVRASYATFSLPQGLVAAVHPQKDHLDVVIAVPLDKKSKFLFDSIDFDYKWRNLPSGFSISTSGDAKKGIPFVKLALERVGSNQIIEVEGADYAVPKAAFQAAFQKKYRHR